MKLVSHLQPAGPSLYVIPLLNAVLLLLVFFFLGSTFIFQSGVGVSLPASPSRLVGYDRADIVTISSGPNTRLFLNGTETPAASLVAKLEEKDSRLKRVVIYADQQAPYGRVMEVSGQLMAAGYEVAFGTTPAAAP
jgi:biopolymer transport protein ExbD